MIDREVLSSRLAALEGYLQQIRRVAAVDRRTFIAEPDVHHLAERYVQLACESVLDIAHHVIADQGWRQPRSYKEAIEVLQEEGLLAEDLAERLKGWVGLRNVLTHFYLDLDHGRIHDAVHEDLEALAAFGQGMARLLQDP